VSAHINTIGLLFEFPNVRFAIWINSASEKSFEWRPDRRELPAANRIFLDCNDDEHDRSTDPLVAQQTRRNGVNTHT
jgi:hypothetical protein